MMRADSAAADFASTKMEFPKKRQSLVSSSSGSFRKTSVRRSDAILAEFIKECDSAERNNVEERNTKLASRSSKLVSLARAGIHSKTATSHTSIPSRVLSQKRSSKEGDKDNSSTSAKKDKMGQKFTTSNITPIGSRNNVKLVPEKEPTVLEESSREDRIDPVQSTELAAAEIQAVIDGLVPGDFMMFDCRTVRIGSLRASPTEKVVISTAGMRICIPALTNALETREIIIRPQDISRMLAFINRSMPVMFVYCKENTGKRVVKQLEMNPTTGPYYCPVGTDFQRRIVLLPTKLPEDSKTAIYKILGDKIRELSNMEANTLLIRCSIQEVNPVASVNRLPVKKRALRSPFFTVIRRKLVLKEIMTYPPPPAAGGISINTEDYSCLAGMMFLNDIIIDFYLHYLTLEVLSEVDRERTHVFSTFFYKRLTTRQNNKTRQHEDAHLNAAEKRHARVKSWTKRVNIFEKDFIVVPINESSHWFLAVICFPALAAPVYMASGLPVSSGAAAPATKRQRHCPPESVVYLDEPCEDRDEAEPEWDEDEELGSDDEFEETLDSAIAATKAKEKEAKKSKVISPDAIKQPCILVFDSLPGPSRSRTVATLRDYLTVEYKTKFGTERVYNKDVIKGACPKVPTQNNFYDCGLYLLQYVESFFEEPILDYKLPIRTLKTWFEQSRVAGKREEISKLLKRLMEADGVNVAALNLPELSFVTPDADKMGNEAKNDDGPEYSTVTTLCMPREDPYDEPCEDECEDASEDACEEVLQSCDGMDSISEPEDDIVVAGPSGTKRIRVK